ncbi:4-coumarate--CoA ligase 6-like [Tropilaelaps mercedesae]|uniref:4-coumarate--CoA ligase 6-like n=1 Tax=Tropilaelaps mercedesae TaxID=418985 RepID=A0A1V9XKE5_9ACAR|nr:4-coumarate--CoA ligase 6-like [Tropilaelaps mercedesae]
MVLRSFWCGGCGHVDVSLLNMIVTSELEDRVVEELPAHIFYRNRCLLYGNKVALIEYGTGRILTFNNVLNQVERLAGAFQELGISARDRVAVHGNNSIDIFLAYLAVHFVNATVVACKTTLTVREMVYQCLNADVKFIITDDAAYEVTLDCLDQLPEVKTVILANVKTPPGSHPELRTVQELLLNSLSPFEPPVDVRPREDEVLITFTSGTTGLPKGVLHTHFSHQAQLLCSGDDGVRMIRGSDILLQWCPISHVSGSIFFPTSIATGATSVVANARRDVEDFIDICEKYEITNLMAFPVILQRIIELLTCAPGSCRSVKHILTGGSVIPVSWSESITKLLNLRSFRILFGMSECLIVTITEDNQCTSHSVGKPLPNTRIKVVDIETGETLGLYQKGELAIKTDFVMKGYDKRPDATDEVFTKDGWLLTGDFGYVDTEGQFYICERLKQLIKCLDNQVSPAEIEDVLLQTVHWAFSPFVVKNPAVAEVNVIGLPHETYGEAPTAYIVLSEGHAPSNELKEELIGIVKREFAYFKHLYGGVFFLDHLPKTDSGKFSRSELKKKLASGEIEVV